MCVIRLMIPNMNYCKFIDMNTDKESAKGIER